MASLNLTKVKITLNLEIEEYDEDGLHDILMGMHNELRDTFRSYDMNLKSCEVLSDPDPRRK